MDEHGRVGVVAAGVHDAIDRALEWLTGVFGHGERVHVAAQEHCWTGSSRVENGRDTAQRLALDNCQPQTLETLNDFGLRPRQVVAELGVLVKIAPEGNGGGEEFQSRHSHFVLIAFSCGYSGGRGR